MRKMLLFAAAGLALSLTAGVPSETQAGGAPPPGPGLAEFCRELADLGYYPSVGDCLTDVLDVRQGDVRFCKYLQGEELLEAAGFSNLGECVSALRQGNTSF